MNYTLCIFYYTKLNTLYFIILNLIHYTSCILYYLYYLIIYRLCILLSPYLLCVYYLVYSVHKPSHNIKDSLLCVFFIVYTECIQYIVSIINHTKCPLIAFVLMVLNQPFYNIYPLPPFWPLALLLPSLINPNPPLPFSGVIQIAPLSERLFSIIDGLLYFSPTLY